MTFKALCMQRGGLLCAAGCITLICKKGWAFALGGRWLFSLSHLIESEDERERRVCVAHQSPLRRPGGRSPTGITARRVHSLHPPTSPPIHPQVTTFYVIKLPAALGTTLTKFAAARWKNISLSEAGDEIATGIK